MSYIFKIINIIRLSILIKYYCKKYGIDEKEAKNIAKNKLVSKSKKRKANKVRQLIKKRRIATVTSLVTIFITLITAFVYYGVIAIQNEQMAAVAAYNIASQETTVEGEYVIYTGEATCDLYGVGGLDIEADILNKYGVQCNGKFALKITYRSYENYGFTYEDDKKTIIANNVGNNGGESVQDTEATEESTQESIESVEQESTEVGIRAEGRKYKSDESIFANCISYKSFDLTMKKQEYELVFHSGDEDILEKGTYLTGYNWIISQVCIVDIEKRREWQIKDGYSEGLNASDDSSEWNGKIDGTLNPQQRSLKNWYQYISDIEAACKQVGITYCKPYQLIGTFFREVNSMISSDMNSDTWAYEADLTSGNDGSDKASGILTQESNNGYGQWNKSLWDSSRMRKGSINAGEVLSLDSTLGISRPNCWYASDQVWTTYIYNANAVLNNSTWKEIEADSTFASLDDIDKSFIFGFIVEAYHNRGVGKVPEEKSSALKLAEIASTKNVYGMNSLYDMADKAGVVTWVESDRIYKGAGINTGVVSPDKAKYDSTFGLNWHSSSPEYYYQEYAYINALCGGYKCYNQMMGLIAADSPSSDVPGVNSGGGAAVVAMAQQVWDTWQAEGCNYYSEPDDPVWYTTTTYGRIRPDCSGYVSCVLWQLGYMDNYNAIDSRAYYRNDIGWTVAGYGNTVELQPGDIIAYNGHVQIFAGWDSSGNRLWYSWGSNYAATHPAPSNRSDSNFANRTNLVVLRAPN